MSGIAAFFRVLSFMPRSQKRNFFLAQVGIVIMVVTQLMIPQLVQDLIDDGILASDTDRVVSVSFQMILWATLNLLVAAVVAFLASTTATNLAHAMRTGLYDKITTLSHGNVDRLSTSDLLVRLTSDVNIMKTAWMMTMYMLFQAPWLLLGAVALVAIQTPSLLWIMAVVMGATIVIVLLIAPTLGPLYAIAQRKLDGLNNVFFENIAGIRVVKAFNRDALESERFGDRNAEVYEAQLKPAIRTAMFQPVLFGLLYCAVGLAVIVSGDNVAQGVVSGDPDAIKPGELSTFFNYLITSMIPIMIVTFVLPELGKFEASVQRALEVFHTDPDVVEPDDPVDPGPLSGRIEFRDVTMAYLGDDGEPLSTPVLHDVSFTVEPGETVAVLGQTGSGKTTLVSLVPRFYDVTGGSVLLDGHDVRSLPFSRIRADISVAEQQAVAFAGSFAHNIGYGMPDAGLAEVARAATVADAAGFIEAQLDGYEATVSEGGTNLSGGQRQRLSLARAVASDPRILILDDTTSAVDVVTEARIRDALDEAMAGRTVLLVAQRITTAMRADKILLLDHGTIADCGTHHELLQRSELYREIAESQLGSLDEVGELLDRSS